MDAYHGRTVAFQYGYFIEGVRIFHQFFIIALQLQYAAFLYFIVVVVDFVNRFFHFFGRYVGQKAEASRIDAQNRNVFLAYTAGGFQKRAVTADADNHIGAEIVTVEQFGGRNVEM